MIKIGAIDSPKGHLLVRLSEQAIASLPVVGAAWAFFPDIHDLLCGLNTGAIQTAVIELSECPPQTTESNGPVVVTALSARENIGERLVMHPHAQQAQALLQLKRKAKVFAHSRLAQAQLLAMRPDLVCHSPIPGQPNGRFAFPQHADAVVLSALDTATYSEELSTYVHIVLPQRDFLPAAGQGAVAWLAHREDSSTRRLLKHLHRPEIAACTNVERKLLRTAGPQAVVGAFCEQDNMGNYHAFAAQYKDGELRRARLSSSTFVGMETCLWKSLSTA